MSVSQENNSPAWDEGLAVYAPGRYLLVALHYVDDAGALVKRSQMHGVIESADPETGFRVALRGGREGKTLTLPPDARAFRLADLGEYRMNESGDVVSNPDLISTWTLKASEA